MSNLPTNNLSACIITSNVLGITVRQLTEPKFLKLKQAFYENKHGPQSVEYLERHDSVGVLIYHKDHDLFTWTEQFRVGQALGRNTSPNYTTIEPVAGMIELGQTPQEAARREILEESGIACTDLYPVGAFLMCPGISTERMHLFAAVVQGQNLYCDGGLEEEQEHILLHHWTYEQTQVAFKQGRLNNAHAQILWLWTQQNMHLLKSYKIEDTPSLGL